jgi:hypothetical protein
VSAIAEPMLEVTLADRARFAHIDAVEARTRYLREVAYEVCADVLDVDVLDELEIDVPESNAEFLIEDMRFRAEVRMQKAPMSGSNPGIEGLREDTEVHTLRLYRNGSWHEIRQLADLGKQLNRR